MLNNYLKTIKPNYIIAIALITALTLFQFLPILYFPYATNDSFTELWSVDLAKYFKQAIGENRVLRYGLVWFFSSITDSNINGLLLVRIINLLIYLVDTVILFVILQKFINKNIVLNVLFIVFFNALQSSQIQLAWADLSIHQILYFFVYLASYFVLKQLDKPFISTIKFNGCLFLFLLVINACYPSASLNMLAILVGYLFFKFNKDKHLKPAILIIVMQTLALIASFIIGKFLMTFFYDDFSKTSLGVYIDTLKGVNHFSLAAELFFDSMIFGDTYVNTIKRIPNAIVFFSSIVILVLNYKGKMSEGFLKYGVIGTMFIFSASAAILKCGYTVRTTYPIAIIDLFFIYYALTVLFSMSFIKNSHLLYTKIALSCIAFFMLISANFSIMRGFIYPKLKEVDFIRYNLIAGNLKKGDEVVIILPNISNAGVYGSSSGVFEFDFAYNLCYPSKNEFMDFIVSSLNLNYSDYKFTFVDLEKDDVKIGDEYKDRHIIDMREFTKAEELYASYIAKFRQTTILK